MLSYEHPQYLWYIAIVPLVLVLLLWHLRDNRKKLRKLGDEDLVKRLFTRPVAHKFDLRLAALLAGITLLFVAMASPRLNNSHEKVTTNSRQIMFCLDLSNSMNCKDLAPSRLERAKLLIKDIVTNNAGENFGLIIFAGKAYLSVPVTEDLTTFYTTLQALNTDAIASQGTAIGDALHLAANSFQDKLDGGHAIILISDGEDHEGDLDEAVNAAKEKDAHIITVGIGTEEGAVVLDAQGGVILDEDGKNAVSKINSNNLERIANDGACFNFNDNSDATNALNTIIESLYKGTRQSTTQKNYSQLFMWPLAAGLGLLIFYFIPQSKKTS